MPRSDVKENLKIEIKSNDKELLKTEVLWINRNSV